MNEQPLPHRRPGRRRVVLRACAAGLLLAACEPAAERSGGASIDEAVDAARGAHPRAQYLTSLTFVGFEAEPALAHFRFVNRADRNRLVRTYRGWIGTPSSWRSVLGIVDTLPVARAAWRVLPGGGLRLGVGVRAQIDWLTVALDSTSLRVQALDAITSWSSATGQRESLQTGEVLLEGREGASIAESGLLLQRQSARPLDADRPSSASQAFVVTDTLGNGVIILRNRALPDAPASVWAFLDGERIEWTDAVLISLSAAAESPGRWSLEIASDGIVAEIEGFAPASGPEVSARSPVRLYPVDVTLSAGELRWTMSGMGIDEVGP